MLHAIKHAQTIIMHRMHMMHRKRFRNVKKSHTQAAPGPWATQAALLGLAAAALLLLEPR